jgi:hypothetical protein
LYPENIKKLHYQFATKMKNFKINRTKTDSLKRSAEVANFSYTYQETKTEDSNY